MAGDVLSFHAWALAYDRQTAAATDILRAVAANDPHGPFGSFAASFAHALRGESRAALAAITPAFEGAAAHSEMFSRELAHCCALAGDTERALTHLERAIELGMWNVGFLGRHDWFLESLHGEPRFQELLERARRRTEALHASGKARHAR